MVKLNPLSGSAQCCKKMTSAFMRSICSYVSDACVRVRSRSKLDANSGRCVRLPLCVLVRKFRIHSAACTHASLLSAVLVCSHAHAHTRTHTHTHARAHTRIPRRRRRLGQLPNGLGHTVDLELHVVQHDDRLRHRRSERHAGRAARPSVQQRDGSANNAELVGTRHRRRPGCVFHRIEVHMGRQCERADHSSLQRVANHVVCPLRYAV
jgi:hypothetical protein